MRAGYFAAGAAFLYVAVALTYLTQSVMLLTLALAAFFVAGVLFIAGELYGRAR